MSRPRSVLKLHVMSSLQPGKQIPKNLSRDPGLPFNRWSHMAPKTPSDQQASPVGAYQAALEVRRQSNGSPTSSGRAPFSALDRPSRMAKKGRVCCIATRPGKPPQGQLMPLSPLSSPHWHIHLQHSRGSKRRVKKQYQFSSHPNKSITATSPHSLVLARKTTCNCNPKSPTYTRIQVYTARYQCSLPTES
jgi:hypothetical protein